ncbi:hypothetical protein PS834_00940 [Pseudomonas fluorescens]|nr:hypothetical protein PS834_00940 [Pseudomonas fluorescens]
MVPSAAPYSVTWNAERQVTTQSPLTERAFLCLGFCGQGQILPYTLTCAYAKGRQRASDGVR